MKRKSTNKISPQKAKARLGKHLKQINLYAAGWTPSLIRARPGLTMTAFCGGQVKTAALLISIK